MAMLIAGAAAFSILLQAATPGGSKARLGDAAMAFIPAVAMGGLILWLMFATPQNGSTRQVLIRTTLASAAAVLVTACVWLFVFLTR